MSRLRYTYPISGRRHGIGEPLRDGAARSLTGDERELVGVFQPEKRRCVQEAVARQHVDDPKKVVRRNPQGADQRLLDRLGHVAEPTLVVAAFEHMNFCEWHLKVSLSCKSLR